MAKDSTTDSKVDGLQKTSPRVLLVVVYMYLLCVKVRINMYANVDFPPPPLIRKLICGKGSDSVSNTTSPFFLD